MLMVEGYRLKMTKGDDGYITIQIPGYKIQAGDTVKLSVSKAMVGGAPVGGASLVATGSNDLSKGTSTIKIPHSDSSRLSAGRYYYDVQVTMANGDIHTVIPRNIFEVLEEVTV